jgi:hypothetical protein
MVIPAEFDEIRPYTPEELPGVYEELIADPSFREVMTRVFPQVPFEALAAKMRLCKTNLEFQKAFCYGFLWDLVRKCSEGMTMDCSAISDKVQKYTFVSNHRDIVLDSAFLSVLLVDHGMDTVEIAIGDNLLVYPWIKKLVRVNKSFIVQRALTMRQMLESSARLSRYMHFALNVKKENIWIAQREGRAKDSNDRTQESVLKMLAMGGEGSPAQRLADLHIAPLSISYEFDPCDYLKAREFQMKRDCPEYKKSQAEDLLNMQTGIFGYKGHIHFHVAPCLNPWLEALDPQLPKTEFFSVVAKEIDRRIHRGYRLFPGNYVACDLLEGGERFASHYSLEERDGFVDYINKQINRIELPNKDVEFLRLKLLEMYANPVRNYLIACEG